MKAERIYTNIETGVSYKITISLQTNAYERDFYWTVSCTKREKGKRKWQGMYDNPYWGRQFQGMTPLEAHETVKDIIIAEVPWQEIYECQKQILLQLQKPCVKVPIKELNLKS